MIRDSKPAPKRVPKPGWKWEILAMHYGWMCPISKALGKSRRVNCMHHAKIPNTEYHRRCHPLLVHSILNLRLVYNAEHINNGSWGKISDLEAEKWERFLERHPRFSNFVNGVTDSTLQIITNYAFKYWRGD